MSIIWKGIPKGYTFVARVLLDHTDDIYVEKMTHDLLGGERWDKVSEVDEIHGVLSGFWSAAVAAALGQGVKR